MQFFQEFYCFNTRINNLSGTENQDTAFSFYLPDDTRKNLRFKLCQTNKFLREKGRQIELMRILMNRNKIQETTDAS